MAITLQFSFHQQMQHRCSKQSWVSSPAAPATTAANCPHLPKWLGGGCNKTSAHERKNRRRTGKQLLQIFENEPSCHRAGQEKWWKSRRNLVLRGPCPVYVSFFNTTTRAKEGYLSGLFSSAAFLASSCLLSKTLVSFPSPASTLQSALLYAGHVSQQTPIRVLLSQGRLNSSGMWRNKHVPCSTVTIRHHLFITIISGERWQPTTLRACVGKISVLCGRRSKRFH